MSSKNNITHIAKGTIWSALGAASSQGILIISIMICAQKLSNSELGKLIVLNSTITTLGILISNSIGASTIRNIAIYQITSKYKINEILTLNFFTTLAFGSLTSLSIALCAKDLSTVVFTDPTLESELITASLGILFTSIDGYYKNLFIGYQKLKIYAFSSTFGSLLSGALIIGLTLSIGFKGVSISILIGSVLQATASVILSKKTGISNHICSPIKSAKEWRSLVSISLPSLLANGMITPIQLINQAILGTGKNGFAEIAIYGIAMNWYNAVVFIPQATGKVVIPILTQLQSESRNTSTKKLLTASIISAAATAIPGAILIFLFSGHLLSIYEISHEYGNQIISITAAAAAISAIQNPIGNIIAASSKFWQGFIMNFCWASIYVSSAYLMRENGALGVVTGLLIAYIAHLFLTIGFAYKHIYLNQNRIQNINQSYISK